MAETALQPISVFIVDDHPVVRKGYEYLLGREDDLVIRDQAASAEEALDRIPSMLPDLAVVDISLVQMDGLELTRRLRETCPRVKVLIVSMHNEVQYVKAALEAGARGYIVKDTVNQTVVEAAREVMRGNLYICGALKEKMHDILQ